MSFISNKIDAKNRAPSLKRSWLKRASFKIRSVYLSGNLLFCVLPSHMPASAASPARFHIPWRVVLLGLLVMLVFTQCRRKREPELYLLPRGFVGNVVVVYNQPNGQPREYHAGTRVYRVPSGGIVYSPFGPNNGVGLPTEYRYTDAGTRAGQVLRYNWRPRPTDAPDETVVCCSAPITDSNTPRTHYLAFVVAPNRQLDSLCEQRTGLIFRLMKEIQQSRAPFSSTTP